MSVPTTPSTEGPAIVGWQPGSFVNSVPYQREAAHPGNLELEARLEALTRWNAMAMVVRANREHPGLGGHIATYASAATLYEVALNHCIEPGDVVYFQGHASPGLYARAYLEGRLGDEDLRRFRREALQGGLSSYPHPWLMPDFWAYPTVSMGLGPLMAIHQARLIRHLHQRGLLDEIPRVWCFLGDGECDEPEALSALTLAARESLDHLVFVVNGNLQRLDGPVRGNGNVIVELSRRFAASGWHVIRVLWGRGWDPWFERPGGERMAARLGRMPDGDRQRFMVADGATRRELLGDDMPDGFDELDDGELEALRPGGHDPVKVHAAYHEAMQTTKRPTVVLAQTVKGWGIPGAAATMSTHQLKQLDADARRRFCDRFDLDLSDETVEACAFVRPEGDAAAYLDARREGSPRQPRRKSRRPQLPEVPRAVFDTFDEGSGERDVTTTAVAVKLITQLLDVEGLGDHIVPIVPDEARTFGMQGLFRKHGIYAARGQSYSPIDQDNLAFYRESETGQILEEGISEASAMADFIAAGTAHSTLGESLVPFYAFYSMFGMQRVGDLIWAASDARTRGFLLGATAGRTTLSGEGLQHQDGQSHLLASAVPTCLAYDPAYAYEVAAIIEEGLRRFAASPRPELFYLTLYNEAYPMPSRPASVSRQDIVRGAYRLLEHEDDQRPRVTLMASGTILREAVRARELLARHFDVSAEVWSVTSWNELRRDAMAAERERRLDPGTARRSHLEQLPLKPPIVAASDYVALVPDQIARFAPRPFVSLGTDGFGRSDTRATLRRFFEVDAEHIAFAALTEHFDGDADAGRLRDARSTLGIDPSAPDPYEA